ncbi:MAG: hypothetical protein M1549_00465 [Candidatus Dependentiae bacterium]|nr:hypothetical protein [Candidatus Dependentiae bacterium]
MKLCNRVFVLILFVLGMPSVRAGPVFEAAWNVGSDVLRRVLGALGPTDVSGGTVTTHDGGKYTFSNFGELEQFAANLSAVGPISYELRSDHPELPAIAGSTGGSDGTWMFIVAVSRMVWGMLSWRR